jgi:RecJ-like exonuclease
MKRKQMSFIKVTCQYCNGIDGSIIHGVRACHACNGVGYFMMKKMKGKKMTKRNKTLSGWLTVTQAAFALGILPKSVMRRIQRGTMKFKTQKNGTRLVFLKRAA